MIKVENLCKNYKDIEALKDVTFEVESGSFLAVTGRSGSGKSTLLKCMSGLIKPTSGNVIIDGKDIYSLKERERCHFRNAEMGFVFQSYALEPKYTAYENIELPLLIGKVAHAERKKRIEEVAEYLHIAPLLKKTSELLSGGEKQRIAIGRAIANRPKVIFADEPCGNLDKANSENIIRLLKDLSAEGITVIMVTHQKDDAAQADRVIELLDGQVV